MTKHEKHEAAKELLKVGRFTKPGLIATLYENYLVIANGYSVRTELVFTLQDIIDSL